MNERRAWYKRYLDDEMIPGYVSQTNPITGEIWFESDAGSEKGGIADWVSPDRIVYKDPKEDKNE